MRTWQTAAALRALDEAVALLAGKPAETSNLAAALLNRSFAYLNAGDVRRALLDLIWCQQVAADGGHDRVTAKTLHNLGYCDLLAGDIPAALQLFTAAAGAYRVSAPDFLPVLAMDKARALLAAGLASDAASELDAAMDSFRRQRLDYDLAEAELARAEAALAVGEPAVARRWAAAAQRRFRRQGNDACVWVAELTRLRARSLSPGRRAPIAAEARLLAERLRSHGLANDAALADLLAARSLLAAGHTKDVRRLIGGGRGRRAGGAADDHPAAPSGPGRAGGAGRADRDGAGRAAGGPGHGSGSPGPARQRRPADRNRRPGRGAGRGWAAAGA